MSEAEYLDSQCDGADELWEETELDRLFAEHDQALTRLIQRMDVAKRAEVGATIPCAQCGKLIVKKTYHKVFCSNARTHGKRNCKDRYHNRVAGLKEWFRNQEADHD